MGKLRNIEVSFLSIIASSPDKDVPASNLAQFLHEKYGPAAYKKFGFSKFQKMLESFDSITNFFNERRGPFPRMREK